MDRTIPKVLPERGFAYDRSLAGVGPSIKIASQLSLDRQIRAEGATWLDREIVAPTPRSPDGFGQDEVARAKLRTGTGEYHRDHLRALAQRVEVVSKSEIRLMGKIGPAAHARCRIKHRSGGERRSQFCTEVAPLINHKTRGFQAKRLDLSLRPAGLSQKVRLN
ncbi:DUF3363 domain-containing protein [Ancylobacter oerskovii]|uniref:DUF3363 domain-containing protein n=1 Tax=Ancylobacter oerskovii TaxID=459519 RepID=A0ABW4Z5M4_9HYPH|nr:DUF3363 domain-containing protein [Ancylobacter oerskovii]